MSDVHLNVVIRLGPVLKATIMRALAGRFGPAVIALATLWPRPALAAELHEMQLAQALFEDARKLMAGGKWTEACPKLEESQRLDPGVGTLLNLALCNENIGRLATAHIEYSDALAQAIREKNAEREQFAREHLERLTPRVPKLTIRLACEGQAIAAERTVIVDNAAWTPQAHGLAVFVDPGEHRISVRSKFGSGPLKRLRLKEGEQVVDVLDCDVAPAAPNAPHAALKMKRSGAFWVTIAGAGAFVGTSVATGAVALALRNSAASKCNFDRNYCATTDGLAEASGARTMAWVSTGFLAGAIVTAAVAFILPKTNVAFAVAPTGAIEVRARF